MGWVQQYQFTIWEYVTNINDFVVYNEFYFQTNSGSYISRILKSTHGGMLELAKPLRIQKSSL